MDDLIALLPMKAHSERVPNKNFRKLDNKPLFQWILNTLLSIKEIDKVVINTDAREVLRIFDCVDSERVVIRDRKPSLCGDMVSMNKVLEDDIDNTDARFYLMTHTTNPLLTRKTISDSFSTFKSAFDATRADSLFSVNRVQTRFYRHNGAPINHDPNSLLRTQDLEPWFEENSNLYFFSKESFKGSGARIGKHPILYETPRIESFDIDDMEDWKIVECLVEGLRKAENDGT